ncbi:hypothetical protein I6A60_21600 [Frankia sp. AgB1.9]|uniref:hypothetical protein n=1 Tax=unclassified Frankia TaxID=2632575 RepID=UPI001933F1F6|nr:MULTISPECIES: hypothetical protein [unclassified Frankia]MBL7488542.1 hypothetical protein [Frankia sp. AgW1.1]MBL7550446.1 hypothetical protein [Frankia sp. AgB1.9]MBL7620548.1 hypothetical protein [Frankia sp. AgB1.8]
MSRDDFSGRFDPAFTLAALSRRALCVLGREWLLHGHMQDRVGMPLVLERSDRETMEQAAIVEWMAASPVYSRRAQRALGFAGDSVETIFKNIQLDIGAPHQFLDFRYRLQDARNGDFSLASCGALLDVEPMGEEFVHGMCHTIEDPTFDATAGATNPRAAVRPVHRPPRRPELIGARPGGPGSREPHCQWTVRIGDDAAPVAAHPNEAVVAGSNAATINLPVRAVRPDAEPGGWDDYSGPFDPDFQLEDLSLPALLVALDEVALQSHLLVYSYLLLVQQRFGADAARVLLPRVFTGLAGLTSQRLRRALRLAGGLDGVAWLLRTHPMFAPAGYVDLEIELAGDRVRFALRDCPALDEVAGRTWFAALEGDDPAGLAALATLVHGVEPQARVSPVRTRPGERFAYEATVDAVATPAVDPPEVELAKISTGASFLFRQRRPVRTTN